jgi:hypothetical protein
VSVGLAAGQQAPEQHRELARGGEDRDPVAAPSITFTGNGSPYTLLQTVNITCSPSDATSGIDSALTSCPGATGLAWTFGAGSHTLNANATDNAGNSSSSSSTFTVMVTVGPLCQLTSQCVDGSAKYQALGAKQQAVINALSNAACNGITRITAKLTAAPTAVLIKAYQVEVKALGASGWLTSQQVSTLTRLQQRSS